MMVHARRSKLDVIKATAKKQNKLHLFNKKKRESGINNYSYSKKNNPVVSNSKGSELRNPV